MEIKFRAWDAGRRLMIYECERAKPIQFYVNRIRESKNGSCIMQYVGKKDILGNDIYEGDIVKMTTALSGDVYILDVYFRGFAWRFGRFKLCESYRFGKMLSQKFEVIGNVYETPELVGSLQKHN